MVTLKRLVRYTRICVTYTSGTLITVFNTPEIFVLYIQRGNTHTRVSVKYMKRGARHAWICVTDMFGTLSGVSDTV